MIIRQCAGGVVFWEDKVLLLKNDKGVWSLPKGVIRHGNAVDEVALTRVQEEAGVEARIIGSAGDTSYEFFSCSRQRPVCNMITWFIMKSETEDFNVAKDQGFTDGGFFALDDALNLITHNQEKSLVRISNEKVKELLEIGA